MNPVEIVVGLLLVAVILTATAQRLGISYPSVLVLGGLALGFVPGLPQIQIPPQIAFLIFIPPLVYQVATRFALRDLRQHRWPIIRLSVGLVLVNLVCVAGVAHWGLNGFSWAVAFVLAAVVSPTDTAAVSAVTRGLPIPRRVERVLEGESLFNDVVALVAYQQAVKAAVTGSFSIGEACGELVWDAAGGIVVGIVVGILATWIRRRVHDPAVNTAASLLTPFAAYIGAEAVEASGVVATVTTGLYVGHVLLPSLRAVERIQTVAFWDGARFILEGLAFVLIGSQLRLIAATLGETSRTELLGNCILICVVTVGVRFVWMFVWGGLPHLLGERRAVGPRPPLGHAILLAWSGMRGVDSLAAALALPLVIAGGVSPFPQRNLILLIAFSVILTTLVIQGFTLPFIIRRLVLPADVSSRGEELRIRLLAAEAVIGRIEELAQAREVPADVVIHLRELYQLRMHQYRAGLDSATANPTTSVIDEAYRLLLELLKAEREVVLSLWYRGLISDDTRHRVERAMDYEELRLNIS